MLIMLIFSVVGWCHGVAARDTFESKGLKTKEFTLHTFKG
jgi:hypothetical protein